MEIYNSFLSILSIFQIFLWGGGTGVGMAAQKKYLLKVYMRAIEGLIMNKSILEIHVYIVNIHYVVRRMNYMYKVSFTYINILLVVMHNYSFPACSSIQIIIVNYDFQIVIIFVRFTHTLNKVLAMLSIQVFFYYGTGEIFVTCILVQNIYLGLYFAEVS